MDAATGSLNQAVHDLVHGSKISAKDIAKTLGINHQILINKANANNTYHKLSVHELHAIQILTGNDAVIRVMQADFVLSTLKDAPPTILEEMIKTGKECGDVFAAVQEALSDNKLTEIERSKILKEMREAIAQLERAMVAVMAHGNPSYQHA